MPASRPNPRQAPETRIDLPGMSALAQIKAGELRNIANLAGLQAWLGSLGDDKLGGGGGERDAASRSWLLSVGKNWMVRHGAVHELRDAKEAPPESRTWVEAALKAGRGVQALDLDPAERERLAGILDWLRSDEGPAVGSDWSKVSLAQAEREEKAWIEARGKAAAKRDMDAEDAEDAEGSRLYAEVPGAGPDGREGWRWVEVESAGALDREGALMKHCVGSYAREVAEGKKSIYSLRDADNKPWLTAEAQGARLTQLKAFANKPCPRELRAAVAAGARKFESEMAARGEEASAGEEIEKAGVVFVKGLGLGVEGATPPAEWAGRLRARLAEKGGAGALDPEEALIALSRLGWVELVEIALPACGEVAASKALEAAAGSGRLAVVELLLPHSEPKARDSRALSLAAKNGHLAIVELLLPHSEPKADESRALSWAAQYGRLAVVELLLPHSAPKENGSWALRMAAEKGHLAIVELLLPHSEPKADESRALSWAAQYGRLAVVEMLLPHSDPKARDSWALSAAAENGHLAVVELLLPHSDPKACGSEALRLAAHNGHLAVVELLLPCSDPKGCGSEALRLAAKNGHVAVVELLLPHSDPKERESRALSVATQNGHLAVAELLLPHSDPKADDSRALSLAAKFGRLAVVELLLPHSEGESSRLRALARDVEGKHPEVFEAIGRAISRSSTPSIDTSPADLGSQVASRRSGRSRGQAGPTSVEDGPVGDRVQESCSSPPSRRRAPVRR